MILVNMHDAKTNFSKLVKQALMGEEVIIANGNNPIIRLVPYTEKPEPRKGGQLRGILKISDDFDAPLPENLLKTFYEGDL